MRETGTKRKDGVARCVTFRPVIDGIVRDAQRLGVSRYHLWAVLSGRRESPGLVTRYRMLRERGA